MQRPLSQTWPPAQARSCQPAPYESQICALLVAPVGSQRVLKGVQTGARQRPVSAEQRLGPA